MSNLKYKALWAYLRKLPQYKEWRDFYLHETGNKCWITDQVGQLEVHHLGINFTELLKEVLKDFPSIKHTTIVAEIHPETLHRITQVFFSRHSKIRGIALHKSIHKEFHKRYGKISNSLQQLQAFKTDFVQLPTQNS